MDSKAQDFGFHEQKFSWITEYGLTYLRRSIYNVWAWISSSFAGLNIENGRRSNRKTEKSKLRCWEVDLFNG